jgi:hypothetical protein
MSGFLRGEDEAMAVREGRWSDVHSSTRSKVKLIAQIAQRAHERTLDTDAGYLARFAGPLRLMAAQVRANPLPSAIAGVGTAIWVGWTLMNRIIP